MMQKKIIFDCDDILWNLNQRMCDMTGIDYNKLVTFSVYENPLLSEAERQKVLHAYRSVELFTDIVFYDGIHRISDLDADVHINSNAISELVANIKRKQLREILGLPDENIMINIIEKDCKKKTIPDNTYIFVDDSCHNIATSPAVHNLMIQTPWNTNSQDVAVMRGKRVEQFHTLNQVIDRIEELLKKT